MVNWVKLDVDESLPVGDVVDKEMNETLQICLEALKEETEILVE